MSTRQWAAWELELMTSAYPDYTTQAISIVLHRSVRHVYQKARSLGLKKSQAYLQSDAACRMRRGDELGKEYRFKPGHIPANKGLRRPGYAPGSLADTKFKKGAMTGAAQHNYVPVGSLRVTRYASLERKVTDDPSLYPARRWRPVAHLVWEAANGPIPAGHIVRFKVGMHTTVEAEVTLDRLECMSKAENMRRNTVHRYPKEIKDAIRSVAVLNRRINHVEKHTGSA